MTKHDRAKMRDRLLQVFPDFRSCGGAFEEIYEACVSEVDRAVRAERKRQRNDEAAFVRRRENTEERFIEAMRELGRARACSANP